MKPMHIALAAVLALVAVNAAAQRRNVAPHPAVLATMDILKTECTRETPCKYSAERSGDGTLVVVEFTRKETPASEPKPYPGGRARFTFDSKVKLEKRVDGD